MRNRLSGLAISVLLMVLALQLQALPVQAAKFKLSTDPKKTCSALRISGEIVAGDYNRFADALKKATEGAPVRRLYLNSIGGQLRAAFAMTDLIRQRAPAVETIVEPGRICNSACVVILAAGSQKYVSRGAGVLIHRAYDPLTKKSDVAATKQVAEFMVANGMPPRVLETMASLRPKEQVPVTRANAKKLGFERFKFYKGANPPATAGCSWIGPAANKS
jgi:hypothetical protein